MHFPLYANSVSTTDSTNQLLPSRLTLTPASTNRPNDPALLESALKLVNSLNSKRGSRGSTVRSRYRTLPTERSWSGSLQSRDAKLTAYQAQEDDQEYGPRWLRSALLTPERGESAGMYASSRDAVKLGPLGSPDTLWNSASPTYVPPPNLISRPFQSEWVDRSEDCEPEFISDLRPIPTMDPATCSPPPTPSSFRPWGFDSLGEVSDSSWTEWDALATGPVQEGIDTKNFWTKHAAPAVTPPEILVPDRDSFSAQLEKGSLPFQAGPSTDLGPLDGGSFPLSDDSGLVIDPDTMLASAHFADQDDDVFLPSSHHEAGAEYPSTAPTTHNHISDSPAGSEFSPNIRHFLPLASSPFLPTAASSYGNGNSNSKSFSRPVHHPDPAPKYDDSEDYLYDGVDDSFFEFLDATANMKDFGNAASSNDTTMLDSSF